MEEINFEKKREESQEAKMKTITCDRVKDPIEALLLTELLTEVTALPEVRETVGPEMFEDPDHGFIYEAILAIYDRGEEANLTSVDSEMRRMDGERWKKMGGTGALGDCLTQPMHTQTCRQYAEEIRRRYRNRQTRAAFTALVYAANDFGADPDELLNKADRKLLELREAHGTGGRHAADRRRGRRGDTAGARV